MDIDFTRSAALERWQAGVKAMALAENARRVAAYRLAHENWAANVEQRRAFGLAIPPAPTPGLLVRCEVDDAGEPRLVYGPGLCCDVIIPPPEREPQKPGVAAVGAPVYGWPGHNGIGPGDTMPDGAIVEQGGKRYRKHVVLVFGAAQQWYEVMP